MTTANLLRRAAVLAVATLPLGATSPSWSQTANQPSILERDALEQAPSEQAPSEQKREIPKTDFVLANLESTSPLNLMYVVTEEWAAGNKLTASFWYFIWQIRTEAWAAGLDDPGFSQFQALLNDQLGRGLNIWISADTALLRDTAERAIGYEAKLPLWSERPDGLDEAQWAAVVAKARADYADEYHSAFAGISDEEIRAKREEYGLPIGTPTDQGEALPDDWR